MSYFELYEVKKEFDETLNLLKDIVKLSEAANYQNYAEKVPWLTKKEFDKLVAIDPTANKMYSKWLVDKYIKIVSSKTDETEPEERKRRYFEDADAQDLRGALELFYKVTKTKGGLISQAKKDISGIEFGISQGTTPNNEETRNTLATLRQKIAMLEGFTATDIMAIPTPNALCDLIAPFRAKTEELVTKKEKLKDAVLIYEGPQEITTPDGEQRERFLIVSPRSHLAARKYGADTRWCTAVENPHHYNHYSSKGPLYIIIDWATYKRGTRKGKWQIHIPTDQFKDGEDNEVDDRAAILRSLPKEAQAALASVGINVYTYKLQAMFSWRNRQKEDDIDIEEIRDLLNNGASLHVANEAVLKWAVKRTDAADIIDRFLQDPETDRSVLADLVAEAANASNFEFVQRIVSVVGPDAINANGSKALIQACAYPISPEDNRIYELAKKAIKTNSTAINRLPPREAIERAVGAGGMQQYDNLSQKVEAFYQKAIPIIKYFVEAGADVNAQNGEPLSHLCTWSNDHVLWLIEYFIQHGADVNANHSVAYWKAYNNFRPKVLKLLVANGAKAT